MKQVPEPCTPPAAPTGEMHLTCARGTPAGRQAGPMSRDPPARAGIWNARAKF